MGWCSRKTDSPRFLIRREVTFFSGKCRKRVPRRRTPTNLTGAQLKQMESRTWFGRGHRLGSSMVMMQRNCKRASLQPCRKPNLAWEPIVHRVGGSILRVFCKLRSEKQKKETRRWGKHCLRRKPECLITSAVWRLREGRLDLDLNDFDAPLAKPFGEFLRSAAVRNQTADSVVRSYSRNTASAQFAEVRNHVHFARGTNHHVVELGFEHIRSRWAVLQIEAVHRQEKTVRMKLVHHRFRLRSHERIRNRAQQSADHN